MQAAVAEKGKWRDARLSPCWYHSSLREGGRVRNLAWSFAWRHALMNWLSAPWRWQSCGTASARSSSTKMCSCGYRLKVCNDGWSLPGGGGLSYSRFSIGDPVRALRCDPLSRLPAAARRLRATVAAAARTGYDVILLFKALKDATFLRDLWKQFLPRLFNWDWSGVIDELWPEAPIHFSLGVTPYILSNGSQVTIRKLFGEVVEGSEEDYCMNMHVIAVFVQLRLAPLIEACNIEGVDTRCDGSAARRWVPRVLRRAGAVKRNLPVYLCRSVRFQLVQALMLFAARRELDHARVLGWPIGGAELSELLEVYQSTCPRQWPEGKGAPWRQRREDLVAFEHLARLRLKIARSRSWISGGEKGQANYAALWVADDLRYSQSLKSKSFKSHAKITLRVIHLGTHAALYNMLKLSIEAAIANAKISLKVVFIDLELQFSTNTLYDPAVGSERSSLSQSAMPNLDAVLLNLRYRTFHHDQLDASYFSQALAITLQRRGANEANMLLCTVPFVVCSLFDAYDFPVVHYAPTVPNTQVNKDCFNQVLSLFRRMALSPRNHFFADNIFIQHQIEHLIHVKISVLPVLCYHTNATYTGRQSNHILLRDRNSAGLFGWLLARLVPSGYPFRFVHYFHTDREHQTFASHRAVVYVPYTYEGQMTFFEMYGMNIPIFLPVMTTRYVWPRMGLTEFHPMNFHLVDSLPKWRYCRQFPPEYSKLVGKHRLKFSKGAVLINYTISCSGSVYIHTHFADVPGHSGSCEKAQLHALDEMDGFGHTHVMRSIQSGTVALRSHDFSEVRLLIRPTYDSWAMVARISPSQSELEMCGKILDRLSHKHCLMWHWRKLEYVDSEPPQTIQEVRTNEGMEKSYFFGNTHPFLEAAMASRRRRGSTSPFDLRTHRRLREHSKFMDPFLHPGVELFSGMSELFTKIVDKDWGHTEKVMRRFNAKQRARSAWRWAHVVEVVASDDSQSPT